MTKPFGAHLLYEVDAWIMHKGTPIKSTFPIRGRDDAKFLTDFLVSKGFIAEYHHAEGINHPIKGVTYRDIIGELCKYSGVTRKELTEDLGLGKNYIYNLEKHTPSYDKLVKIADYFGVSMDIFRGAKVK